MSNHLDLVAPYTATGSNFEVYMMDVGRSMNEEEQNIGGTIAKQASHALNKAMSWNAFVSQRSPAGSQRALHG